MGLFNKSIYDGSKDFEIFRGGKYKKKTRAKYTNPNITRKEYADKLKKNKASRDLASTNKKTVTGTAPFTIDYDYEGNDVNAVNTETATSIDKNPNIGEQTDSLSDSTEGRVLGSNIDDSGRRSGRIDEAADEYVKTVRRDSALKLLESALAATEAVNGIIQLREEYAQMAEQSDLNKTLIDEEIDRMITSGQGQAMLEQAAGRTKAETEQLKLAAQGQRLSGAGARRVERSHQLTAVANAVDARTAMISRAMGYEYEKISIDRDLAYADISRKFKTFGGLVRTGFHLAEGAVSSGLLGGSSGP